METIDFTLQRSRRRSHDLMLGQQVSSQNAFEASKRRKLKMYNNSNIHNRQRLKRRSNALTLQDENGSNLLLTGGKYCHNIEQTMHNSNRVGACKRIREEDSKDIPKFTQRHLELLSSQHLHKVNELQTIVNKQQDMLKRNSKDMNDLKTENAILKRGVIIQEAKNKQLTVETSSYKTLMSQMKDYISKLEQRNYSLQIQLSQRNGMEPFHSSSNNNNFSNHGF
jgi:hypothetical protein